MGWGSKQKGSRELQRGINGWSCNGASGKLGTLWRQKKTPKILKRDHEKSKWLRKGIFFYLTQWEAILLEQLAPHCKTNILVELCWLSYLGPHRLRRKQILKIETEPCACDWCNFIEKCQKSALLCFTWLQQKLKLCARKLNQPIHILRRKLSWRNSCCLRNDAEVRPLPDRSADMSKKKLLFVKMYSLFVPLRIREIF